MNVIKVFLICGFYEFICKEVDNEEFINMMEDDVVEFDEEFLKV